MKMQTWTQKNPHAPNETAERNRWRVIIDLIDKGYEVFKKVGPSGKCDFVIIPGRWKIKVKTARQYKSGKIYVHPTIGRHFDVMAKVLPDRIIYEPDLPFKKGN